MASCSDGYYICGLVMDWLLIVVIFTALLTCLPFLWWMAFLAIVWFLHR
jgi:hypothetical protein